MAGATAISTIHNARAWRVPLRPAAMRVCLCRAVQSCDGGGRLSPTLSGLVNKLWTSRARRNKNLWLVPQPIPSSPSKSRGIPLGLPSSSLVRVDEKTLCIFTKHLHMYDHSRWGKAVAPLLSLPSEHKKERRLTGVGKEDMSEEEEAPEPPAWMREYGEEDAVAVGKLQCAVRSRQARVVIRALRAEEAKRPQNTGWAYDTLRNVYVCSATTVPKYEFMGDTITFPAEQQVAGTVFVPDSYEGEKDEQGRFHGQGKVSLINGSTYNGMWHEGLMHGVGTLKWSSGVSFKGPFVHGRIRGKGIMRWPGGNVYDGEVVDGHRHGKGKFVMVMNSDEVENEDAVVTYEGMWANGKRNGVGTLMYDADGKERYEGEWLDDLRHGTGIMYYRTGNVYRGGWRYGKQHGQGQMMWYTKNEVYMGGWKEGLQDGKGEHVWFIDVNNGTQFQTQNRYKGGWSRGLKEGNGVFEYADGSKYSGEWANDKKDGEGTYVYPDGKSYVGTFKEDRMMGERKIREAPPGAEIVLSIDDLLANAENPQQELAQIKNTLLQYLSELKQIFRYYSQPAQSEAAGKMTQAMHAPTGPGAMGRGSSTAGHVSLIKLTGTQSQQLIDNAFAMSMLDFWKFAKECHIPDARLSIAEIDRIFLAAERSEEKSGAPGEGNASHVHNPSKKLIFRQFVDGVVRLADYKYNDLLPVSRRLSHALYHNILPYACQDLADDIKQCMESSDFASLMLKVEPGLRLHFSKLAAPKDTLRLRSLLDLLRRRGLIDAKLTHSQVVNMYYRSVSGDVLYVEANAMNIDSEMIFEEFLEVMLRIGEIRARNGGMGDTSTNKGFVEMASSLLNSFIEVGVKTEGMPPAPPPTVPVQLPGRLNQKQGRHPMINVS